MNSTEFDGVDGGGGGAAEYDPATSSKLQYWMGGGGGDEVFGPDAAGAAGAASPQYFDYGTLDNGNNTGVGVSCHIADPAANGTCAVGQTCHTELLVIPVALISIVYLGFVGWLIIGPLLNFSWNPIRDWCVAARRAYTCSVWCGVLVCVLVRMFTRICTHRCCDLSCACLMCIAVLCASSSVEGDACCDVCCDACWDVCCRGTNPLYHAHLPPHFCRRLHSPIHPPPPPPPCYPYGLQVRANGPAPAQDAWARDGCRLGVNSTGTGQPHPKRGVTTTQQQRRRQQQQQQQQEKENPNGGGRRRLAVGRRKRRRRKKEDGGSWRERH